MIWKIKYVEIAEIGGNSIGTRHFLVDKIIRCVIIVIVEKTGFRFFRVADASRFDKTTVFAVRTSNPGPCKEDAL